MQHLQHSSADFSAPVSHNLNTAQYQVHASIHHQRHRPYDAPQGGSHVPQMQHPQQTQHYQSLPESTSQLQMPNELMSQHSGGGPYMSHQLRSDDTRGRAGPSRVYHPPTEDPLQYFQPTLSMGHPSMGAAGSSEMGPPTSMHNTRGSGVNYPISGSSPPEQGYTQGSNTNASPSAPSSNLAGGFSTPLLPAMAPQSIGAIDGRWVGPAPGQAPIRSGKSPTRAILSPSRNSMISPVTPLRSLNGETTVVYADAVPAGGFSFSELKQASTAVGLAPNSNIASIGLQCKRASFKKQHSEIDVELHSGHNRHTRTKMDPKCENAVDETELNRLGDVAKKEVTLTNVGNVTMETGVSGLNGSDCGNSGIANGNVNGTLNGDGNTIWAKNIHGLNSTVSSPGGRQWNENMFTNGSTGTVQYDNDGVINGSSGVENDNGNGVYRSNVNDEYNCQYNGIPVGEGSVGNQVDGEGSDGNASHDKHMDNKNDETQH